MKISVIGTGYLGAVHSVAMAHLGFDVVGVDVDRRKIQSLRDGVAPFYEPGFNSLLAQANSSGRLTWTRDYAELGDADLHFICVGTPQQSGAHAADLSHLWSAIKELRPNLKPQSVIAGKSTVPVGTAQGIQRSISDGWPGGESDVPIVVWNPEFLREGFAVEDTLHPDRIVIGLPAGTRGRTASAVMRQVYVSMIEADVPFIETDVVTAELVKVAANAFLATKISFINAMAEVCEATGGDVLALADAIGHDDRIGRRFLGAGVGFGGGCLPKDIRAFSARAGELGVDQALTFLNEVDAINSRRRDRAASAARDLAGGDLRGRRVAVLGAAFKPNSDDVRDSPALDIAQRIHNQGAEVVVHDPKAIANGQAIFPNLAFMDSARDVLTGADVVLLLTEWSEYVDLDPAEVRQFVREPNILDGRNALDPVRWKAAGWRYRGMGREH